METNQPLGKDQYANPDKFNARIYLHAKFRTNPYSWPAWVFDQFAKQEGLKVLELGCGTGLLWKANAERISNTWEITLSDYSEGMLNDARQNLADVGHPLNFMVLNAEDINLPDESFDLVIANHMLYHVANRQKALANIKRILKNNGVFYATTACIHNMQGLRSLVKPFIDNPPPRVVSNFALENGQEQLEVYFTQIEMRQYHDSLEITETDAIVNYFLSLNGMTEGNIVLKQEKSDEFRQYIANKIEEQGKISASMDTGIFICRK